MSTDDSELEKQKRVMGAVSFWLLTAAIGLAMVIVWHVFFD